MSLHHDDCTCPAACSLLLILGPLTLLHLAVIICVNELEEEEGGGGGGERRRRRKRRRRREEEEEEEENSFTTMSK